MCFCLSLCWTHTPIHTEASIKTSLFFVLFFYHVMWMCRGKNGDKRGQALCWLGLIALLPLRVHSVGPQSDEVEGKGDFPKRGKGTETQRQKKDGNIDVCSVTVVAKKEWEGRKGKIMFYWHVLSCKQFSQIGRKGEKELGVVLSFFLCGSIRWCSDKTVDYTTIYTLPKCVYTNSHMQLLALVNTPRPVQFWMLLE